MFRQVFSLALEKILAIYYYTIFSLFFFPFHIVYMIVYAWMDECMVLVLFRIPNSHTLLLPWRRRNETFIARHCKHLITRTGLTTIHLHNFFKWNGFSRQDLYLVNMYISTFHLPFNFSTFSLRNEVKTNNQSWNQRRAATAQDEAMEVNEE